MVSAGLAMFAVALLQAQALPGEPERLPGEPPRPTESSHAGDSPGALRPGLRPHFQVALGVDGQREGSGGITIPGDRGISYGLGLSAAGGLTWSILPGWGLVAQLGVQTALGSRGTSAATLGVGAALEQYDSRLRLTVGPAYVPRATPPLGFAVAVDFVRALRGPLTIGASLGYLQYRFACDACFGALVLGQQARLGISLGYGL